MSPWFVLVLVAGSAGQGQTAPAGPTTRVHGEVVDSATGRPIPCRISIRGQDGSGYFPESASPEGSAVSYRRTAFSNPAIVEMHVTLSAHPFVVRLPPGRYILTAERGKEYHPERTEVTVGDAPIDLTVRLRRWIDA